VKNWAKELAYERDLENLFGQHYMCWHVIPAGMDLAELFKKYWPQENDLSAESYCWRGRLSEWKCAQGIFPKEGGSIDYGYNNDGPEYCWRACEKRLIDEVHCHYFKAAKAGSVEAYFWLSDFDDVLSSYCRYVSSYSGLAVSSCERDCAVEKYKRAMCCYESISKDYFDIALSQGEPHALLRFARSQTIDCAWYEERCRIDVICDDLLRRAALQGYPHAISAYYFFLNKHGEKCKAKELREWALNFAYIDRSFFSEGCRRRSSLIDFEHDFTSVSPEELGQQYPCEGY